jgi:hypothetical protein
MKKKDNKERPYYVYYMRTIFLLQLENEKVFLFVRESDPTVTAIQIGLEATVAFEFVQQNKPISVLDQFPETSPLDLDHSVKKEMLKYGIDFVRGGSYSAPELTPQQREWIEMELQGPPATFPPEVLKEMMEKYTLCQKSNTDLKIERKKMEEDYAKYKCEYAALQAIRMDAAALKDDLEWLVTTCENQIQAFSTGHTKTPIYRLERPGMVARYHQTLQSLRWIYTTFGFEAKNMENDFGADLPLKYPQFLFDDFIYHGHRVNLPISMDRVCRLISSYTHFLTFLDNRLAECEHDVASWGPEWRFPSTIALLDMCIMK